MMKKTIVWKMVYGILSAVVCSTTLMAQTVTIDGYFNQETKKDQAGKEYRFHYIWDDVANSGFSILGDAFKAEGAKDLQLMDTAPTAEKLKTTAIYIMVDPDNKKDNPNPNKVEESHAKEIAAWVKSGGVLLLLANDSANTDLASMNKISSKYGITFNNDIVLHVTDDKHFSDGGLQTEGNPLFATAKNIFIKDAASIKTEKPAEILLTDKNRATVIASSKYGKGTVLAIGDPWLYNEYTNGRLPAIYENDKAAHDLAKWLFSKVPEKKQ
jgi:hypothetical protein